MKKLYSNKLVILSLVIPGLLLFFFAILAPICLSVYYGFTDYSGMGSFRFIGLENYKALMTDSAFLDFTEKLTAFGDWIYLYSASPCADCSSST